jgi:hypothetical protein
LYYLIEKKSEPENEHLVSHLCASFVLPVSRCQRIASCLCRMRNSTPCSSWADIGSYLLDGMPCQGISKIVHWQLGRARYVFLSTVNLQFKNRHFLGSMDDDPTVSTPTTLFSSLPSPNPFHTRITELLHQSQIFPSCLVPKKRVSQGQVS